MTPDYTTLEGLKTYLRDNFRCCYSCGEPRATGKVFCEECADTFGNERHELGEPLRPLDCWTWAAYKRGWEIPWREIPHALLCAVCDGRTTHDDYLCQSCRGA
jgi:hypothetical protein